MIFLDRDNFEIMTSVDDGHAFVTNLFLYTIPLFFKFFKLQYSSNYFIFVLFTPLLLLFNTMGAR
jgi:hypothetical protein